MADTHEVMNATEPEQRFAALWERHYADVLGYARRRSPAAVADDVAAETFAVAWRRIDDTPDDALPWLLGVARKTLANRRRGERRAGALIARLGLERTVCAPDPAELVGGDHALAEAFATLSARDREVLTLVAWEGLGAAEVGSALGIPTPMASARLHRARSRLRRALARAPTPTTAVLEEER